EELAKVACIARGGGRHDENVAFAALFDRDVNHPVVGRWKADRHRVARDPRAGKDRTHVWGHKPSAMLRLVHRRNTKASERFGELAFDTGNLLNDDGHRSSGRERLLRDCAAALRCRANWKFSRGIRKSYRGLSRRCRFGLEHDAKLAPSAPDSRDRPARQRERGVSSAAPQSAGSDAGGCERGALLRYAAVHA